MLPEWKAAPLASPRPSDLRAWFDGLRTGGRLKYDKESREWLRSGTDGLSVDSLRYVRTIMHQALDMAVEDGMLARNPLAAIRLPQARPRQVEPLTASEVRRLLAASGSHRLHAFFALVLLTGARAGELLGLRWDDCDLKAGAPTIRHSLQRVKGQGLVLGAPKTPASQRRIDLPQGAVHALREHRKAQISERWDAGPLWQETGFVFTSEVGKPLDESNVYKRIWLPMLAKAGLPPRRLHDGRHSHASLLLDQGANPKVVQERLGHADIRTTLQLYAHLLPGAQRREADKLDAMLAEQDEDTGAADARARRTDGGAAQNKGPGCPRSAGPLCFARPLFGHSGPAVHRGHSLEALVCLELEAGIEPATYALRVRRSAD